VTILVHITYHRNPKYDPANPNSQVLKKVHYYVFDDNSHDTFFVQHPFRLHWKFLKTRGCFPSLHVVWNDGYFGQFKSAKARYFVCCYPMLTIRPNVATLLWAKWEDETPTPKVRDLESSETPECLELDSKAQNTLHWGVLSVIEKILKRRYRKWTRIGHLDICSSSYGQKKAQKSNWQFDSRPQKVGNRPLPDLRIESATWRWKDLD
jgi:hypothetical protein